MVRNWIYRGKDITDIPEGYIGFVYLITNIITGKIYVGKKVFNFYRKKVLTKKEKLLPENKRKRFKIVKSDSKWATYFGSSDTLNADIEIYGKEYFYREILHFCSTKKQLSYYELKHQFLHNVLEHDSYNNNILGRFYRKDL